jgi:hypothetical protein
VRMGKDERDAGDGVQGRYYVGCSLRQRVRVAVNIFVFRRESGRSINNVAPEHRQMTWRLAGHVSFEEGGKHCQLRLIFEMHSRRHGPANARDLLRFGLWRFGALGAGRWTLWASGLLRIPVEIFVLFLARRIPREKKW